MEGAFSNITVKSQKCDKDSKEIITFFYKSPSNIEIEIENLPDTLFSRDVPNEGNKNYNLLKFQINKNITGVHVHGPSSRTSIEDYKKIFEYDEFANVTFFCGDFNAKVKSENEIKEFLQIEGEKINVYKKRPLNALYNVQFWKGKDTESDTQGIIEKKQISQDGGYLSKKKRTYKKNKNLQSKSKNKKTLKLKK